MNCRNLEPTQKQLKRVMRVASQFWSLQSSSCQNRCSRLCSSFKNSHLVLSFSFLSSVGGGGDNILLLWFVLWYTFYLPLLSSSHHWYLSFRNINSRFPEYPYTFLIAHCCCNSSRSEGHPHTVQHTTELCCSFWFPELKCVAESPSGTRGTRQKVEHEKDTYNVIRFWQQFWWSKEHVSEACSL